MTRVWMIAGVLMACEPEEVRPTEYEPNVPNVASVRIQPSSVDFGNVSLGESVYETIVIQNNSDEPVQFYDVIVRPAGEQVTIPLALHDDILGGIYIPPGDDFRFELSFHAEQAMEFSGELQIWLAQNSLKAVDVVGRASR